MATGISFAARSFVLTDQGRAILLECCLHARKRGDETSANSLHNGDDCNRDAGSDQPVFDGGGTRLVLKKAIQNMMHVPGLQVHNPR